MLNIINLLKKNEIVKIFRKKGGTVYRHIRSIPLNKEWYSSIYTFKKNPIRFLPAIHHSVFKLLKAYFNMYNKNLEIRKKYINYRNINPALINKVWVSSPEIKHLHHKATITIYVYNRLYNQYKRQLDLLEFTWGPTIISNNRKQSIYNNPEESLPIKVTKEMVLLRRLNPVYLGSGRKIHKKKSHHFYIKMLKWLKIDKSIVMEQYKSKITQLMDKNKIKLFNGLNSLKVQRYNYLIAKFKKELIYIKLKQKMLFNSFKFNEIYLTPLIKFLEAIYKKKIEFNVVILKNYYSSSSILSQMAVAKITCAKHRGNAGRPLSHAVKINFVPNLSSNKVEREKNISVGIKNVLFNSFIESSENDSLNKFLLTNKKSKNWSSQYIDNSALKNLDNKSVSGVFLKAVGRLTKRYKAQRAIKIFKYRGALKNVYSAYKGYSSTLSRGYGNINVEKTMIHSKVRIGAFGLTGWVASY